MGSIPWAAGVTWPERRWLIPFLPTHACPLRPLILAPKGLGGTLQTNDDKEKLTSLQEPVRCNQCLERPQPLQAFDFLPLELASCFHFRFLSGDAPAVSTPEPSLHPAQVTSCSLQLKTPVPRCSLPSSPMIRTLQVSSSGCVMSTDQRWWQPARM